MAGIVRKTIQRQGQRQTENLSANASSFLQLANEQHSNILNNYTASIGKEQLRSSSKVNDFSEAKKNLKLSNMLDEAKAANDAAAIKGKTITIHHQMII